MENSKCLHEREKQIQVLWGLNPRVQNYELKRGTKMFT